MQVKKKDIKDMILKQAESEFVKYGFKDSSLRRIAIELGVSTGILYTYFKNKDNLFSAVVKPAVDLIYELISKDIEDDVSMIIYVKKSFTEEYYNNYSFEIYTLISKKIALFRILVDGSKGSSLENFVEQVAEEYTLHTKDFFKHLLNQGFKVVIPSDFACHNFAHMSLGLFWDMIHHNVSLEESKLYIKEISSFMYGGWKQILGL